MKEKHHATIDLGIRNEQQIYR